MESMLTQDDLKAIGTIVGEQIEAKVPPMIQAGIDDLEERMDLKFDAVYEELEDLKVRLIGVEATMVTKEYLDDKLAHDVRKPF